MSTEDLDLLEAEAERLDGDIDAEVNGPQQPTEDVIAQQQAEADAALTRKAGEVAGLLQLAVGLAGKFFPSVLDVWTPEALKEVAEVSSEMAAKYNVDLSVGRWKTEIKFAVTIGSMGYATYIAVIKDLGRQDELAEQRRQEQQSQEEYDDF